MSKECSYCLIGLTRRSQKVYCSVRCQRAEEREKRVSIWLETGECTVSSGRNHYVRKYIMADQGHVCALCGTSEIWNNRYLMFVLDHIDGHSDNNRRENLRLICPNCDSQLDTYKSRNKGNGRHSRRTRYAEGKSY